MCAYLVSLSTITRMASYGWSVKRFFDLGNIVIKFIVTCFHGISGGLRYCTVSYFACILCLFCWQLRHCLIYVLTRCRMWENWQCCCKSCSVLLTPGCPSSGPSWCSLIHSSILLSGICSFPISIGNCLSSSLSILSVAFNFFTFADSKPSLLTLSMLWSNNFFHFIWSLCLLSASALPFSFPGVYTIVNLYCPNSSNHRTCHRLSCLVVVNCNRFLWSVRIVNCGAPSAYTLQVSNETTMARSFLSWTS